MKVKFMVGKAHQAMLVSAGVFLSGCASHYQVPAEVSTAELTLMATSTPASKTTRSVNILAIADEKCAPDKNGLMVAREFVVGNPDQVETAPTKIPAGVPFHFYGNYVDSRFAQNKACTIQASFSPKEGRKYRGVIIIQGDVNACDFGLYDVTSGKEELAAFEMPATFCPGSGRLPIPNGRAARTDWRMEFR